MRPRKPTANKAERVKIRFFMARKMKRKKIRFILRFILGRKIVKYVFCVSTRLFKTTDPLLFCLERAGSRCYTIHINLKIL